MTPFKLLDDLSRLLPPLGEMSLTASYAAAVVIILRLLLKKRAPRQVLCLMWLVVFARLLIPLSLESPLSIVPDAQRVQLALDPPAAADQAGPVQAPGVLPDHGPAPEPSLSASAAQGAVPVLSAPADAAPAAPRPRTEGSLELVLTGVWLAGGLAMGGYGLISYLSLRRRLFDAIRAGDGAWEHPAVTSPFILGMVRPRIYLPAGLYGQPRQFILCHERAHLRRLDHIVKPLCWAALAIHWFNPLVWASFLLMSRDIEAACDEAVIRRLGPGVKADYSATLLSLATGGRVPAPCPLAFGEGNAKGRIQNVLRYRRPALWIVVVSAFMAIMAAVCLLTDPVSAQDPEDGPEPAASQAVSSDAPALEEGLNHLLDPWMEEVLSGERLFCRRSGDREYFSIHQLRTLVYGDEELPRLTLEVGRLAVMDLDRDGVNELVVWPVDTLGESDDPTEIGYTVGYFIFRRQGDEVHVYYPGWRPMQNLKADGTFVWSSSAANWGTGSLWFDDGMLESRQITWCDNDTEWHCFVNGTAASREEFEAAYAAQTAKPEPVWYTYTGGVLSPWMPDSMELAAQTGDRDSGEAKLWLEGGEIPWLEWNGATARLDSLITPGQSPRLYVQDFDGDGQDEAVLTFLLNGYNQYCLYEWRDGLPVLADSYDSQQMLVRFNQNNVAAVRPYGDEFALSVTYAHVEGEDTSDSTDFYRHYVTGYCVLPAGFFDGWEHIRDGYPHAYANGFHLAYLRRDTSEFYFDFDICLADETMQELNYVDTLLAEPPYSQYAGHYMMDKIVGAGGFLLRYDGTQWRLKEWDQLQMDYPGNPALPPESSAPAEPSAAPLVCAHGLDHVYVSTLEGTSDSAKLYTAHNTSMIYRCLEDHFTYVVPAPITGRDYWFGGSAEGDFDGDGRTEEVILQENAGVIMVCDVEDGQLHTCTADTSALIRAFNQDLAYSWTDDGQTIAIELSHEGQHIQARFTGRERDLILSYGEETVPIAFTGRAWLEPFPGQIRPEPFTDQDLTLSLSICLTGSMDGDSTVLLGAASWTFRYSGGELTCTPGSFRLTADPRVDLPVSWTA